MDRVEKRSCFEGSQEVWKHASKALKCEMRFAIYLPPQAHIQKCPVLYWLSGLTCNEQNFITKAGAQRYAAEHGIILVAPDTSPRGQYIPDSPDYDLGQGAGFYINATREPWASNFSMFDYIVEELPKLIEAHFPATAARSISGHSMGGHGALICALKNPGFYKSVSAFAPIVAPSQSPWGEKAFMSYLDEDRVLWKDWDACELALKAADLLPLLIDQGSNDEFLETQLKPHLLKSICDTRGRPFDFRLRHGYDHSYYFIASFIGEHIAYHAARLTAT